MEFSGPHNRYREETWKIEGTLELRTIASVNTADNIIQQARYWGKKYDDIKILYAIYTWIYAMMVTRLQKNPMNSLWEVHAYTFHHTITLRIDACFPTLEDCYELDYTSQQTFEDMPSCMDCHIRLSRSANEGIEMEDGWNGEYYTGLGCKDVWALSDQLGVNTDLAANG
eukprot:Ihof_evm2s857 gene=Ihof_evmTU2s857